MKKIIFLIAFLVLPACTAQKPETQVPTYNITFTDNSQWVVGDGNTASSTATITSEQVAKPTANTSAENTPSNLWIYLLIMGIVAAGVAGYIWYKKRKQNV